MIEEIADPVLQPKPDVNMAIQEDNCVTYFALEFSLYSLGFYAIFVGLARFFLDKKFMAKWKISEAVGLDIACKGVSAIFAVISASLGIYIFLTANHDPSNTQRTTIDIIVDHFFVFGMSYFMYDMYAMYEVYLAKNKTIGQRDEQHDQVFSSNGNKNFLSFVKDNPLMSVHHLMIALVFVPMMARCRDHEPGNLMIATALVMEASTPFVASRSILSALGLKKTLLYVINGLAMIVVFFTCRIAVYPLFFKIYANLRNLSLIGGLLAAPWHCQLFVLITLLPQLYWFRLIVRGALKVVNQHIQSTKDNSSVLTTKSD